MKFQKYNTVLLLSGLLVFTVACNEDEVRDEWLAANPEVEEETGEVGDNLDLSNFVVLGSALSAGFQDGALYTDGQQQNLGALLNGQFTLAGGTSSFLQPDINSANGFNPLLSDPAGGVILGRSVLDLSDQVPINLAGEFPLADFSGTAASLNDLSIPLLSASVLTLNSATMNAADAPAGLYYSRVEGAGGNPIADAASASPSFFLFEAGTYDVMLYALTGADGSVPLTDNTTQFQPSVNAAIGALAAGAEGVVLNIPSILSFPFFQAVPYDAIALDSASAAQLNAGFAGFNQALLGLLGADTPLLDQEDVDERTVSYSAGANPILVVDEEIEDLGAKFDLLGLEPADRAGLVPYEQARPLREGEIVLLSAGAVLGTEFDGDDEVADTPIGVAVPLGFSATMPSNGDSFFLTLAEQQQIEVARATFNATISSEVDAINGASGDVLLVDAEAVLGAGVADPDNLGIPVSGTVFQPDFSPNGYFSTDGLHLNPIGTSIIGNAIIEGMNARWGSSILEINTITLRGIITQP